MLANMYGYSAYGSENYFTELCRLLKRKGHRVIVFTVQDDRNIEREYAEYFVERMPLDTPGALSLWRKAACACKAVYSFEARRNFERLLKDTRPDVVHAHNIKHYLTPSILQAAKKSRVPVVYTLHDFYFACPNYIMFSSGSVCQACKGGRFYHAFIRRCVKDSFLLSLVAGAEHYAHALLRMTGNIDMFVAPSNSVKQKMVEWGMDEGRIRQVSNFVRIDEYRPGDGAGSYVFFCGRLTAEKGIATLIEAMRSFPGIRLVIAGDGKDRKLLESTARKRGIGNVEFRGYVPHEEVKSLIGNALFTVVPSEWYEPFGLVVVESFAMGKPVIGADIGGIPELIDDGQNGFLFRPGDTRGLVEKIGYLLADRGRAGKMGKEARRKAAELYDSETHYRKLMEIYSGLIAAQHGSRSKPVA